MKQTLKIISLSALATAAVIKGVPALAAPADVNVSIVRTADLDLSNAGDRQTLDKRLVRAALEVCGAASDSDLSGQNAVRACRTSVLARGRAQGAALIAARAGRPDILIAAR